MTNKEIYDKLKATFGGKIGDFVEQTGSEYAKRTSSFAEVSDTGAIADICQYLRDESDLAFDNLNCVSCVDHGDQTLLVVYHIESLSHRHQIALKVSVPIDHPIVPSVTPIWASANWHEREGYDMFGIKFFGHPDLRRILLDDDWVGHPLRKDYKHPEFYRGMKVQY